MVKPLDPKSKHKVSEAEVAATEPEDKGDVKWSVELNLGFPSWFLLIFIGIGISTYYMNYKLHIDRIGYKVITVLSNNNHR